MVSNVVMLRSEHLLLAGQLPHQLKCTVPGFSNWGTSVLIFLLPTPRTLDTVCGKTLQISLLLNPFSSLVLLMLLELDVTLWVEVKFNYICSTVEMMLSRLSIDLFF